MTSDLPDAPLRDERERRMKLDMGGRLRNTKVGSTDAFLPLFEAVVNSIHATEDRFGPEVAAKGVVEIRVHRIRQATLPGTGRPPVGFVDYVTVQDNGCGFTDENLKSFETADSTAKLSRGGKGIGRFTWLVVFEKADIDSVYIDATGKRRRRAFKFRPSDSGIENYEVSDAGDDVEVATRIQLRGVQKPYADALRKGPEVLADRLFEHCFYYFVMSRCPAVRIVDERDDGTERITVNDKLRELSSEAPVPLDVGRHQVRLRHVRQAFAPGRKHQGHLCANDRVVTSFLLSDVSDLGAEPTRSADGEAHVHHVFIAGAALDDAVDATRTRLNLPDGLPILEAAGALDLKTLREAVGAHLNVKLADLLRAERDENFRRIERHVRTLQPEYARLLEHRREYLERVKWTDNARQMDEHLYRQKQAWEFDIRRHQADVETKLVDEKTDLEKIAEELYQVVVANNHAGQDDLVRYVTKRRAVLQLVRRMTSRFTGPALEKHIHQLVFPMGKTNGQVSYEEHNLWLVDDTLSFYEYLTSDTTIARNEAAPTDSQKEPDILAFKTGDPYQHVSLVEFKRPDRADENPVVQLATYGRILRKGGGTDAWGRTLPGVSQQVRIDAYAVVTLTPRMEDLLVMSPGNIKKVEGESRWYGAIQSLNMTVEVLDFTAFLRRAEQRNQAFFNKLQLI